MMKVCIKNVFIKLTATALLSMGLMAQAEPLHKNLIHLSAGATSEVKNDLMVVRLTTQHEAKKASEAANQVNQDMTWALKEVKRFGDIEARTEQYNTYPLYNKDSKIRAWQASQTLRLQSENMHDLSKVLLSLQARLNIQSMNFKPTKVTSKKASDALIQDALNAFNERAKLVQKALNASGYSIVEIHLNTQDHFAPIRHGAESYSMMSKSVAAAPAVESGKSTVNVTVNGKIQLQ